MRGDRLTKKTENDNCYTNYTVVTFRTHIIGTLFPNYLFPLDPVFSYWSISTGGKRGIYLISD